MVLYPTTVASIEGLIGRLRTQRRTDPRRQLSGSEAIVACESSPSSVRNLGSGKCPDAGDVWLWVAVDADSKLVPSRRLGQRDLATAT
jgi:hypothetical protein